MKYTNDAQKNFLFAPMKSRIAKRKVLFSGCKRILSFQRIPALRFQFQFVAVAGHQCTAQFRLGDVTDDFDILHLGHRLMCCQRDGEEQFVVLAAIQGTSAQAHVELFGHHGSLVVDGNTFLIDPATYVTL